MLVADLFRLIKFGEWNFGLVLETPTKLSVEIIVSKRYTKANQDDLVRIKKFEFLREGRKNILSTGQRSHSFETLTSLATV